MNKKLEEFKVFPIIAWILVIGFAGFTLSLIYRLDTGAGAAETYTIITNEYLKKP